MSWPGLHVLTQTSWPGLHVLTQTSWPGDNIPTQTSWPGRLSLGSGPGRCFLSQTSWPGHLCPIVLLPFRTEPSRFLDCACSYLREREERTNEGRRRDYTEPLLDNVNDQWIWIAACRPRPGLGQGSKWVSAKNSESVQCQAQQCMPLFVK